jgi:hypothetical protein
MKIALILTGHQRRYMACYPSVKQFILDRHDVDVYISTWNSNYFLRGQTKDPVTSAVDIQPLLDMYKPVKVHIEKQEEYYANKKTYSYVPEPVTWFYNGQSATQPSCECNWNGQRDCASDEVGCDAFEMMRDQWYMVKKGFELIDNPEQYDYVMKLRLDILFQHLQFDEHLPKGTIVVPGESWEHIPGWPEYMTNDHLAYGDPESMNKYCHWVDAYEQDVLNKVMPVKCEMAIGYYLRVTCGINARKDAVNICHAIAPKT